MLIEPTVKSYIEKSHPIFHLFFVKEVTFYHADIKSESLECVLKMDKGRAKNKKYAIKFCFRGNVYTEWCFEDRSTWELEYERVVAILRE